MKMKTITLVLAQLLAFSQLCYGVEKLLQASLPYRSVCESAFFGDGDISATTNRAIEVVLRSQLANIHPDDMHAWIDATSGRIPLELATNGAVTIPLTSALWEENPQIVVNQPKGSMELDVYLPKGVALQDALARSLPHDASLPPPEESTEFKQKLTAVGTNWTVEVKWNPGELERYVTWQEADDGFSLGIPLRTRGKPFEFSWGDVTMTRCGPYQPACVHQRNGSDWHVQMSHEQADFPDEKQLKKMLEQNIPGQPYDQPVLSSDGTMVTLRGPLYSGGDTLDVQIWMLTVGGKKPSPELLEPFLRGKITTEPNQEIHGTQ